MANDFMKWRIRTSFRLLGIPHRKNSTVTRMKGTNCPAGKSEWRCPDSFGNPGFSAVDTFMVAFPDAVAERKARRKRLTRYRNASLLSRSDRRQAIEDTT